MSKTNTAWRKHPKIVSSLANSLLRRLCWLRGWNSCSQCICGFLDTHCSEWAYNRCNYGNELTVACSPRSTSAHRDTDCAAQVSCDNSWLTSSRSLAFDYSLLTQLLLITGWRSLLPFTVSVDDTFTAFETTSIKYFFRVNKIICLLTFEV